MGSVLPDDWGPLSHVPKLIRERNLQEVIPTEWQAKEKWGTSITPADEARGYLVFRRHYVEPVYYYSLPDSRADSLTMFASLGEYEPVSFSLYPLRDAKGLRVSVTDLVNEKGSIIKAENIDTRIVRSLPFEKGERNYVLEPTLLEKAGTTDVLKRKVTQIWLTLYAPTNAAPGVYSGKVRLQGPETPLYELKLTVRVLPVKLEEPATLYGMCFLIPGRKNMHPENLDKYYADMREHNMNTQWTWPDAGIRVEGGKVLYDFSKFGFCRKKESYYGNSLDEMMASYLKARFNKPWVCGTLDSIRDLIVENLGYQPFTPEYDRAYLDYVRQLVSHAESEGWPAFSLHPCDEPSHGGYEAMRYAMYYYKLLKENFPRIKTFADGVFADGGKWGKEDRVLFPYLSIMCYQGQSRNDMEFCEQTGLQFWIYNQCGFGKLPKVNRDRWGVYTWKAGCGGCFHWVYTWWLEPNLPSWSFPYVVPAPDGPLPTLSWEAAREGIDDVKYLTTLSRLIERARASGNKDTVAAADEAQQYIETVMAPVPASLPENETQEAERNRYFSNTTSGSYDLNRWRLAERILRLQSLLAGRPALRTEAPLVPKDDTHTLGMWHLDEGKGTTILDDNRSGSGHDEGGRFDTVEGKGNPFWTRGVSGGALQFTTYTAPALLPLRSRLNPSQFTFEAWINFHEIAEEGSCVGAQGDRWSLRLRPGGAISFLLNNQGWRELSAGNLFPNRWYHIAATYDGAFMRLYVDGEMIDFLACRGEMSGAGDKLYIGSSPNGKGGPFFGRIDEVRLSDRARHFVLPWQDAGTE